MVLWKVFECCFLLFGYPRLAWRRMFLLLACQSAVWSADRLNYSWAGRAGGRWPISLLQFCGHAAVFLHTLILWKESWMKMDGWGRTMKMRPSPVWLTFSPLTLRKKHLFPTVWQNNSVVLVAPVSAWIRGRVLQIYKGAPESCLSMCTTNMHLIS